MQQAEVIYMLVVCPVISRDHLYFDMEWNILYYNCANKNNNNNKQMSTLKFAITEI